MKVPYHDSRHRRRGVHVALMFMTIAFMATFGLTEESKAGERVLPFYPGEKLTFQVRWSIIPAGEAVLEILPIETINGVKSYHFVMTAQTYPFIDIFYRVRDRVDSYTDIGMTHSLLYKKQKEGRGKGNVVVNFDWEKQEAQYSSFGKEGKPIPIRAGSFDPLSVFYAFRLHDRKKNPEIQAPVTDGKKCVMGKAKIIGRERIKVASGIYDTYVVEPDLEHIRGVFAKSKDAKLKIWVTADRRRVPVKVKSKVVVGSFVAELISAQGIGPHGSILKRE